ncbi:MAG: CHAT domain-containing protein [Acidobacteriota bacterium]
MSDLAGLWHDAERGGDGTRGAEEISASSDLILQGTQASEAAFKRYAPNRRVLHIATHGFFLGRQCPTALASTRGVGGLVPITASVPAQEGENLLLLSGLALAGANQRARAGEGEEDGILTAEEIAAMDLSGVEWAVLSACETGIGEVQVGEGVFGLRRAFEIAGVRTLILSLWSVSDEATREWMTALYRGRLRENRSTVDAVREATLRMLEKRRHDGRSTHPFFWGAFVSAGDWR